jgi:signal transduction histidine kinase
MSVVQNMAIKHKLILIIMATCIAALFLASSILLLFERGEYRKETVDSISCYAEMIGDNCRAALAFEDAEDARETLKSLQAESSIVFACVYTKDDKVLAQYQHPDTTNEFSPPVCKKEGHKFGSDFFKLFKQIKDGEEIIGTVFIQLDLSQMKSMLLFKAGTITLVGLTCTLVAFLVSSRVQRVISGPILSLAEVAKAVSEKDDYTARAIKKSNDEIGLLIDAFNEMLEQIQQRDSELVEAKEQLETKVMERTAELSSTNEKLSRSNQQLQEFTYVASHDLREPTRKISSFGQMLADSLGDKLEDDDKENLNFMINGADRMQQMIEALLVYSRVSTKGVSPERVDLNEIVDQLNSLELAVKIEETNANLIIPEPLPAIEGDPAQIRQLIQNLISNALKYQKKSVLPEVIIRASKKENDMVKVEVRDNGIGIKKEQYDNVFVMFRRLHSRQEYEGTGIGLAVCKRIVERHGGEIGVTSTYGEGSIFWFTMPASKTPVEKEELEASFSSSAGHIDLGV